MINRMYQFEEPPQRSPRLNQNDETGTISSRGKLKTPKAQRLAKEHPIALITLGLVAGLAMGWWVKRK